MPFIHDYMQPFRWEIRDHDECSGHIHATGEADTLPAARAGAEEALRSRHESGVLARLYEVAPDDPYALIEVGETRGPTWGRPALAAGEAVELAYQLRRLGDRAVEESLAWRLAENRGAAEQAHLARSRFYSLLEALRQIVPEPLPE